MSKELLKACYDNNIKLVKKLLKKPFDIGYRSERNETCLYWASFYGNIELLNLLLENGAKDTINVIDTDNIRCLYWVCSHRSIELVKLLLDNGAIIDDRTVRKYYNFLLEARLWIGF